MRAPETIQTERLILQRPALSDAEAIFSSYASDREVTRYLAWPRHRTIGDTKDFLGFSDEAWAKWPAGPYLARSLAEGTLLGSTGLGFETPYQASTGYAFAKAFWGKGFATEALHAMVELARVLHLRRLYALCHVDHGPSRRVLEKAGFSRENILKQQVLFPNLGLDQPSDVFLYARIP